MFGCFYFLASLNFPELIPIWLMDTHRLNNYKHTVITKDSEHTTFEFYKVSTLPMHNMVLTFLIFSMNISMPLL